MKKLVLVALALLVFGLPQGMAGLNSKVGLSTFAETCDLVDGCSGEDKGDTDSVDTTDISSEKEESEDKSEEESN